LERTYLPFSNFAATLDELSGREKGSSDPAAAFSRDTITGTLYATSDETTMKRFRLPLKAATASVDNLARNAPTRTGVSANFAERLA